MTCIATAAIGFVALLFAAPAYAETTPDGQDVYTALVVDYDGQFSELLGVLIFTEYGSCVDAMNALSDDSGHLQPMSYTCRRFVIVNGQAVAYSKP